MNLGISKILPPLRAFFGSIAGRLAFALIILGIIATVVTTMAQTYRQYRAEIKLIDTRFENVRKSHGPSLAASVWHFSERQIALELQGILNTPGFEYAEVRTPQGRVWRAGAKRSSDAAVDEIPLVFRDDGKERVLGSLLVVAGKQEIYDRILTSALESLTYFGVWTFFLAGSCS